MKTDYKLWRGIVVPCDGTWKVNTTHIDHYAPNNLSDWTDLSFTS